VPEQAAGLSYAVRFPVLKKYFGQLCLVIAALTLLPLAVSLISGETHIAFRYAIVIVAMSGAGILLLLAVGVGYFDALLYTMASVSTGGFAPHDTSLAALGGPPYCFWLSASKPDTISSNSSVIDICLCWW
jgi:Trk-type K+ transport system membrane component